ncbi:MAG: hypothetical protein DMF87_16650 [Acidobacteria bacterium]|nr:MAG: hypothetical protein DMF87_16650 [Acidobacteriota bacterium]
MPELTPYTTLAARSSGSLLIDTLLRRSRVIVICFLALAAGAVLAVLFAQPVWHGQMKILVKRDRTDTPVSGSADVRDDRTELSEAELLSQAELIRANDVLAQTIATTGLAKRFLDTGEAHDEAQARALALDRFKRDLAVTPIKKTWLINVTYKSGDPQLTRRVLDTLLHVYLEKHLSLQRPAGTFQFFSDQADLAHEAMRVQAATALAESDRRLAALTNELAQTPAQRTSQIRTADDAQVMRDVKSRILELDAKRTELLQKFTPEYRGVVELDTQLKQARAALEDAQKSPVREETIADNPTRQWLETELARTKTESAALRARTQSLASAVSQYRSSAEVLGVRDVEQQDLERTVKAAEAKYLLYVQKREEARISDALDKDRIANVVVAESPSVDFKPEHKPSVAMLPLLLGGALILSFAFALAFDAFAFPMHRVFAVQRLDRTLARSRKLLDALDKTAPDIEQQTGELRTPALRPLEGRS